MVYGFPIQESESKVILKNHHGLIQLIRLDKNDDPLVVYHGTSREAVTSINAQGLKPSEGMLGNAI